MVWFLSSFVFKGMTPSRAKALSEAGFFDKNLIFAGKSIKQGKNTIKRQKKALPYSH